MSSRALSTVLQLAQANRLVYSRDQLLALKVDLPLSPAARHCLQSSSARRLLINSRGRRRRGCRSGVHVNRRQLPADCCFVTHGRSGEIPTINGNRRNTSTNAVTDTKALPSKQEIGENVMKPTPCLNKIRISRHTVTSSHQLTFGLLNVQSANNQIDDIIDMKKEHGLDVMLLNETWHDADSVSIRRLRAEGLQVIERSRPR